MYQLSIDLIRGSGFNNHLRNLPCS